MKENRLALGYDYAKPTLPPCSLPLYTSCVSSVGAVSLADGCTVGVVVAAGVCVVVVGVSGGGILP